MKKYPISDSYNFKIGYHPSFVSQKQKEMKRSRIVTAHLTATIIATLTIGAFFSSSLTAELIGDDLFIRQVKTTILYCLPVLIIAMPMLAISGNRLAGKSENPLIVKKKRRMRFIALNGVALISLAIYLFYHATYRTIDRTFISVQVVELLFGAINLGLIGLNINAGLKLSGRLPLRKIN